MGRLRVLIRFISCILAVIFFTIPATAYDNAYIHPQINKLAIGQFETEVMPKDPFLNNATLNGSPCSGYAWDMDDGAADIGNRNQKAVPRAKTLKEWIVSGGYSADEPEWTMALVHFYDPTDSNEPWLTDYRWINNKKAEKAFQKFWDPNFTIPELSALQWAFDEESDGSRGMYYVQDYSWNDGLRYFRLALESEDKDNHYYGQAWRSVGETMHMISDMTVPAHVRNDGHVPSLDPDPYESSVWYEQMKNATDTAIIAPVDYDHGDLRTVMQRVAEFTNQHFLTEDTAPYLKITRTYPQLVSRYNRPAIGQPGNDRYIRHTIQGTELLLAKEMDPIIVTGIDETAIVTLDVADPAIIHDQQRVLIPTAIRASAEVLDRFLPRFDAHVTIDKFIPNDTLDDQYTVHITLLQVPTDTWRDVPAGLVVRNGATLVSVTPDGKEHRRSLFLGKSIWGPDNNNFNDWKDLDKFVPGTSVFAEFDLGGYIIRSNKVVIQKPGQARVTSKPTVAPGKEGCFRYGFSNGTYTEYYAEEAWVMPNGTLVPFGRNRLLFGGREGRPETVMEWVAPTACTFYFTHTPDPGSGSIEDVLLVNGGPFSLANNWDPCIPGGSRITLNVSPAPSGCLHDNPMENCACRNWTDNWSIKHETRCFRYESASGEICILYENQDGSCGPITPPGPNLTMGGTISPPTTSSVPTSGCTPAGTLVTVTTVPPITASPGVTTVPRTTNIPPPTTSPATTRGTTIPATTAKATTLPTPATTATTTTHTITTPTRTIPATTSMVTTYPTTLPTTIGYTPLITTLPTSWPTTSVTTIGTSPATYPTTTQAKTTVTTVATTGAAALVSGTATVTDWDTNHQAFGFRPGVSDLFIADRGPDSIIHVFESPGIIDMGEDTLTSITVAPESGYGETAVPRAGHSYVIRSRGTYGKIRIITIQPASGGTAARYSLQWAYQPDGSRNLGS